MCPLLDFPCSSSSRPTTVEGAINDKPSDPPSPDLVDCPEDEVVLSIFLWFPSTDLSNGSAVSDADGGTVVLEEEDRPENILMAELFFFSSLKKLLEVELEGGVFSVSIKLRFLKM